MSYGAADYNFRFQCFFHNKSYVLVLVLLTFKINSKYHLDDKQCQKHVNGTGIRGF